MSILIWNVRGFNDPRKQKGVVGRIRLLKVNIVCLLETRVNENKSQSIVDRHFQGWKVIHNYVSAINGRIWVLWTGQVHVDVIDEMDQCVTCNVQVDSYQFVLSAIYGMNEGSDR